MSKITPLSELPLSNDFMFGAVMSQKHIAKLFLESLLGIQIDKIIYIKTQDTMDGEYYAHGIRLDVCLKDDKDTIYNIEMQVTNDNDLEYRIRYYQGKIDRETLEKGVHYEDLPDSYIIFVCSFDYFKHGLAVYERKSVIKDYEDVGYDDGFHVFILNSRYTQKNADAPILEFLDYVRHNDSSKAYQSELAKSVVSAVSDVRHDKEKEAIYMTYVQKMKDVRKRALKQGIQQGIQQGIIQGAVSTFKALGKSKEDTQTLLESVHSLSSDEARQEVEKYW